MDYGKMSNAIMLMECHLLIFKVRFVIISIIAIKIRANV